MLACVYEDRVKQLPGVKLLIASMNRHQPELPIRLRFPGIPAEARAWIAQYPQVTLLDTPLEGRGSYNVKASVLLDGLSTGASSCLWLDTDVMVNGRLAFLETPPLDTVIVTQDPWDYPLGSTRRCASFGLVPGRDVSGPMNSAVLRVSQSHAPLLHAWADMLKTESYLAEQAKPVDVRNPLMLGDQDVISALLASTAFAAIPLRVLQHPTEILQHHGPGAFGIRQRWSVLRTGLPPLLHAMGSVKPWNMAFKPKPGKDFRGYYERLYLESSPYVAIARQYKELLDESGAHWLDLQSPLSRVSMRMTANNPVLSGTLQATIHQARHALASK